ncbi:MAG: VOC family protein, partial [Chloroflexota bacterium]
MTPRKIVSHTLQISNPKISLDFYQNKLGMHLISEQSQSKDGNLEHHYYLSFRPRTSVSATRLEHPNTLLKLIYQDDVLGKVPNQNQFQKDGYWKIGITLEDVDLARESLLQTGVEVSEPRQFRDIGYLCHLADPDGHSIELLQHTFNKNEPPSMLNSAYVLNTRPTFGQITLRVKDAKKSLRFYQQGLGMRLLSRQVVEPYNFTLYFLAYTNDKLPFVDIDHVGNREWLWQRPYTTLELQHNWGTEEGDFAYRVGSETGFIGM